MLKRLRLENFKASRNVDLPMAPLTVLSGMNSSGKSTTLQALAALRQSYLNLIDVRGLLLNGELIELGSGKDVLNEDAADEWVRISVVEDERSHSWRCKADSASDLLIFDEKPGAPCQFVRQAGFQFLRADRTGPALMYPKATRQAKEHHFLGVRGEFTADFLEQFGNSLSVEMIRRIDNESFTPRLLDQANGWLQLLSPGVDILSSGLAGTNSVRLGFRYTGKAQNVMSDEYRPTNVGFGLSYVLPVIVACLSANAGDLLLFENPEAHLHPQGQAAIGQLIARCAASGVQVILETHSDHLLNGIRVAVRQSLISADDIALHFFSRGLADGITSIDSPRVLSTGRLSHWPNGFFDQWDKSLDLLLD